MLYTVPTDTDIRYQDMAPKWEVEWDTAGATAELIVEQSVYHVHGMERHAGTYTGMWDAVRGVFFGIITGHPHGYGEPAMVTMYMLKNVYTLEKLHTESVAPYLG